jgi:phytoene synthase
MPVLAPEPVLPDLPGGGGGPLAWLRHRGRHSRSFSFAARWLPDEVARPLAGIYAYSRVTTHLVTPSVDDAEPAAVLARWRAATEVAWAGGPVEHALIRNVMADSLAHGVSFEHVERLLDGVEADVEPRSFATRGSLRRHTRAVAGSVGGWLTERAGVRDPGVLERAYDLGHALQLTNIVRDVGDDLDRGRCYLPRDAMTRHGLDHARLVEVRSRPGGDVPPGYAELMEELMAEADASYDAALDAVVALPGTVSRATIVAARVYQGLHGALRRAGYDSLHRRVHTTRLEKTTLAAGALAELVRMDRVRNPHARRCVGGAA